jgi:hypothetical protein
MSEDVGAEMPRYRSHKIIHALKIEGLFYQPDGSALLTPAEAGYATFSLDKAYVEKHQPKAGGYYVVYADGYKSWSPAKAFEEGYTRVT